MVINERLSETGVAFLYGKTEFKWEFAFVANAKLSNSADGRRLVCST